MYIYGTLAVLPLALGELATNCYLVWDTHSMQGSIIDPADDGEFITQKIIEQQFEPISIVLTHGHFDHVLGLLETKLNFSIPIYMHPDDNFLLQQAQKSAYHWLHRQVDPVPPADLPLTTAQAITIGAHQLEVIETPGHTPGSVSLWHKPDEHTTQHSVLFAGDCVFKDGIGRTDFSYSSLEQMHNSLHTLTQLPQDTVVFSGHGEPTTIGEIKLRVG